MSERELIPAHILDRKGPRSLKDLNPEVVEYLNKGLVETKNLMEWLATDQLGLLKITLGSLDKLAWYDDFEVAVNAQKSQQPIATQKSLGKL
ncbi:hypothetical protein [Kordia sp.]|uniref:hypothetical protein n=1 Tax=Kordia sp. TaxID=1965332 RepID=UPI0025C70378|nr:hypothetical protein [Kordia sp.]MCH2193596.1 hypothetical protein [Kordia sp.]